jgi:hypothetical protein
MTDQAKRPLRGPERARLAPAVDRWSDASIGIEKICKHLSPSSNRNLRFLPIMARGLHLMSAS